MSLADDIKTMKSLCAIGTPPNHQPLYKLEPDTKAIMIRILDALTRYTEALEFYASHSTYHGTLTKQPPIDADEYGKTAREALAQSGRGTDDGT